MRFLNWLLGKVESAKDAAEVELRALSCRSVGAARYDYVSQLYAARIESATKLVEHFGRLQALGKSQAEQELYDKAVAFLTMHLATTQT